MNKFDRETADYALMMWDLATHPPKGRTWAEHRPSFVQRTAEMQRVLLEAGIPPVEIVAAMGQVFDVAGTRLED